MKQMTLLFLLQVEAARRGWGTSLCELLSLVHMKSYPAPRNPHQMGTEDTGYQRRGLASSPASFPQQEDTEGPWLSDPRNS